MKYTAILVLLLLAACTTLLSSCAAVRSNEPAEKQAEKLVPIETITILPVDLAIDKRVPIDKTTKQQLLEGQDVLNKLIAEHFVGRRSITFITEQQVEGMEIDLSLCNTYMERTRAICLNIRSDAALVVALHRYRKRAGNELGVTEPASVAFDYKLIQVKTGKALCWGKFDETQKPLLDDLFSIVDKAKKRGVKWIKAEELAKEGIKTKFDNCPYLKQ